MPPTLLSSDEFANKIKAKYPQYSTLDNATLTQKMLAKYPEYQSQVQTKAPLVTKLDASIKADQATFPATSNADATINGASDVAGIAARTTGNVPSSAIGFAKSIFDFFNPLNTIKTLSQIPEAAKGAMDAYGGNPLKAGYEALKAAGPQFGPGGSMGEAAKQTVPLFIQHIFNNDLEKASLTLQNDPVGQLAPLIMVARDAIAKTDPIHQKYLQDTKNLPEGTPKPPPPTTGRLATFDSSISKVAQPVISAAESVGSASAKAFNTLVAKPTKFAAGQMTGMSQDTIGQVLQNPEAFTKDMQATMSRQGLGTQVADALAQKETTLNETGQSYAPIRQTKTNVAVDPNYLVNQITEKTGLQVTPAEGGYKVEALPTSSLRAPSDVRALQNLVDFWQPVFEKGTMTSEEFLNLRQDLADLSKFDRQIGKSHPVEAAAQRIRGDLNTTYRGQVPGLESTDTSFATQISDFNRLKKGVLDSKGELTDAAINRIANASNATRDIFGKQLEEISPGITGKIKILKAVEDIKASMDNKVGTYTRAGLGVGGILTGIFTMNPYSILGIILTVPEVAVPVLRGIGMSAEKAGNLLHMLGQGLDAANQAPNYLAGTKNPQDNGVINAFSKYIKANPPAAGLSIKDVNKMTPEELAAQGIEKKSNSLSAKVVEEVKKYNTPDKFVAAQQKVLHGTSEQAAKIIESEGFKILPKEKAVNPRDFGDHLYFTNRLKEAKYFGKTVIERYISPDANIFPLFGGRGGDNAFIDKTLFNLARGSKMGQYDAVVIKGGYYDGLTIVSNLDILKSKSQLIDIWKKANDTKTSTLPIINQNPNQNPLQTPKAGAAGLEKYKVNGVEISPLELDTLKGVLFAEISNRSLDKQKLEARVIVNTAINRMKGKKGATLNDIISAPQQYQGYESPEFMRYMSGKTTATDAQKLKAIDAIIEEIKSGKLTNPIENYQFYYHKPDGSIAATKKFAFAAKSKSK